MRFHSLMVEALLYVNRNRRFIRDGKFCLLVSFVYLPASSSSSVLRYVHRGGTDY